MYAAAQEAPRIGAVRIKLVDLIIFTAITLLFVGQVVTGTPMLFAFFVATFNILGMMTVKALGGPLTIAGGSVALLMFQHIIISQVAKVFFLQDATGRLLAPMTTMLVYNLAMLGILAAAMLYRVVGLERIKPLFEPETNVKRLYVLTIILTVASLLRYFLIQRFGVFEGAEGGVYVGGFVGPLRQFGFISTLAVAVGTAHIILKTNGQRCVGMWNVLSIVGPVLFGILGAGRQDAVTGIVTFILTLVAFRFKLRPWHYAWILITGYVFQEIIFPYALYARGEGEVRIGSFETRVAKAAALLTDVALNPGKYKEKEGTLSPQLSWNSQRMFYYGRKIPTLDRYSVINATDNIVNATLIRGPQGEETALAGFAMLLPRFLNPHKEALGTSNKIAHFGDGLINESDFYTQITIGFIAESFMCFKWAGVFFLPMLASFFYFSVYRLLFRPSLSRNIFVVSLLFVLTWRFSESPLAAITLEVIQTPIYLIASLLPLMLLTRSLTGSVREAPFIYEQGAAAALGGGPPPGQGR